MATNKTKVQETAVEEVAKKQDVKPVESTYTALELANNHKIFNVSKEIVVVALRLAKKETATFEEAKKIIDKFKNKEVK